MAMIIAPQNSNGFVFARSDAEFEQHMEEAKEASKDDFAFRIQLEETLQDSSFTFAYDLQLTEIGLGLSSFFNPSTSKDGAASSSSYQMNEEENNFGNYYVQDNGYGGEYGGRSNGKKVATGLEWRECSIGVQKPVPVELCGICYEDAVAEMFEGIHCLHRFCHPCMTKYIHTRLEQRRHQIYCPHDSCTQALSPQECGYFLPAEIMETWSAVTFEAEIPDSQKVYCPFPGCSAMLLNEDIAGVSAEEILNAECPFCNRMFCVRCMVPWHADIDCEEFQMLPPAERSEEDLQLFKLAEARKWQRCPKCNAMIELVYGCNHITCRCGHEFCYECRTEWMSGRPTCNCPRIHEHRLLQQT